MSIDPDPTFQNRPFASSGLNVRVRHPGFLIPFTVLRAMIVFGCIFGSVAFAAMRMPLLSFTSVLIAVIAFIGMRYLLESRWVLFDTYRRVLVVSTMGGRSVHHFPDGSDVTVVERRRLIRTPIVLVENERIVLTPLDQAFDAPAALLGRETPKIFLRQLAGALDASFEVSTWQR